MTTQSTTTNPALDAMWEALKAACCKNPAEAKLAVFVSEKKFKDVLAPFAAPSVAPEVDNDRVEEIKRWRERFTGYHADHAVALRRAFGYIDYLLERLAPASTVAPQQSDDAETLVKAMDCDVTR